SPPRGDPVGRESFCSLSPSSFGSFVAGWWSYSTLPGSKYVGRFPSAGGCDEPPKKKPLISTDGDGDSGSMDSGCSCLLESAGFVGFGSGDTFRLEARLWIVEVAFVDNAWAGG